MTDYFALLDQPRAPWLDLAALREVYHRKTLESHPDAAAPGDQDDFVQINEAYQVLHDPKRRLHHLLSLENVVPASGSQSVPPELGELFLLIGELNHGASQLLERKRTASNALSRSLLEPQLADVRKQVGDLHHRVRQLLENATDELREINSAWEKNQADQFPALSKLYSTFSYLGRWTAQLDELAFQLS